MKYLFFRVQDSLIRTDIVDQVMRKDRRITVVYRQIQNYHATLGTGIPTARMDYFDFETPDEAQAVLGTIENALVNGY